MTRSSENRCFRRFQQTRDPRLLAKVFDATAAELLRVAGHLSNGDRELTQDALQATFLTAIEKADSYDTERDVRPWLLGILANHVRKERRRTLRHRGSDVTEAELPAKGSLVADVQGAEFGSAAKAAMKKLPSPFKEAVVLHLVHGLTATEIAEALGRPAGTVRTQIVRGMDRLRALLPAGFTAAALSMMLTPEPILAAVRSNVLAVLPPVAIASSSFFLVGWRLYAMIAASLTVALSVLFSLLSDPVSELPVDNVLVESEAPVAATADVGTPRELVVSAPPKVVQPATKAEVKPQRPANLQRVALKVVYKSDGTGAANVPVAVRLDGDYKTFHTDGLGRCELWLPWPGLHEVFAIGARSRATMSWHDGQRRPRVHKARIEIDPGMVVDVRVTDTEGQPIAGATVESSHGTRVGATFLTVLGKTDAGGRFQRRDLPISGQMRVWAPGYLLSEIRECEGRVGKVTKARFQLKGGALKARGRVLDENGKPIGGAHLALVPYTRVPYLAQYLWSDRSGNFELHTMEKGKHVLVGIHNEGKMRRGELRFVHDGLGEKRLELRLTRGARVVGVLKNSAGQPWAGANVVARHRPEGVEPLPFMETWTKTAAGGSFELDGLAPSGYDLETDRASSQHVTLREGETREWNPTRVSVVPTSFRLLNADGKPLDGWMVAFVPPGSDYETGSTLSRGDGRPEFHIRSWDNPPGGYGRFHIYKKLGKSDDEWHDHSRQPSLRTPPVLVGQEHVVHVPKSAYAMHDIVGVVKDHNGAPLKVTKVVFHGVMGQTRPMVAALNDETGEFRLDDLPPGSYRGSVELPDGPDFVLPPIELGRDRVASFGDVIIPELGRVVVTLPEAAPVADLTLRVVNKVGTSYKLGKQEDGTWRTGLVHQGDYDLRGWSPSVRIVTKKVKLDAAKLAVDATFVPHKPSKVILQVAPVPFSKANQWIGHLTAAVGVEVVDDHWLHREFDGLVTERFEFLVSLPVGDVKLKVKGRKRGVGSASMRVPANGGGEVVIQIR